MVVMVVEPCGRIRTDCSVAELWASRLETETVVLLVEVGRARAVSLTVALDESPIGDLCAARLGWAVVNSLLTRFFVRVFGT